MNIESTPKFERDRRALRAIDFDWCSHFNRALISAVSPSGTNSRLSILIYHRVLPKPDPLFPAEVDAQIFDWQIGLLKTFFNIIPLAEAVSGMQRGGLPARPACITFDDGYADNAEVALPILQKHGAHATFFVATGFLDGGRMWNDTVIEGVRQAPGPLIDLRPIDLGVFEINNTVQRQLAITALLGKLKYLPPSAMLAKINEFSSLVAVSPPTNLMMSAKQVRNIHSAGMEIGGHTVSHPILALLERNAARNEIAHGREALENIVRAPVRLFAYPNGKPGQDYLPEHVEMVKQLGFDGAVSTAWGASRRGQDQYQLPRFTPWDRARIRFTIRLMQNMLRKAETV